MSILRFLAMGACLLATTAQAQFSTGLAGVLDHDTADTPAESAPSATIAASTTAYEPQKPFFLALDTSIPEHQHAYFRNPATMGLPMTAELSAPAGFNIEGPYWQIPTVAGELYTFYGYSEHATVVWQITPEANAPDSAEFSVTSSVQLCNDMGCQPPTDLTARLKLTKGSPSPNPAWANQQTKVEKLGDTPLPYNVSQDSTTVTIRFSYPGEIQKAIFFSNHNEIAPQLEQKLTRNGSEYTLILPRNDNSDPMYPVEDESLLGKPLPKLSGILTLDDKWLTIDQAIPTSTAPSPTPSTAGTASTSGTASAAATVSTPSSPTGAPPTGATAADPALTSGQTPSTESSTQGQPVFSAAPTHSEADATPDAAGTAILQHANAYMRDMGAPEGLLVIMGSLFLGGLILNLMPCVFPVIGLKIMSFVQLGGGNRGKVFTHSLAFVLGILVSFWILTLLLVVFSNLELLTQAPLREWWYILVNDAGSDTRSWAVWMSNPWAVYIILLLLVTLGLSMFGVFEIGVGATTAGQELQNKGGLTGSFFQGLLVTVVATPCSAPFLGTSLPAAMAMPAVWMMVAMTAMALGLAFPYIVLGAFPSLVGKLPRPGAWMESLKQGLSFLLFAAAAWFLTVYFAFLPEDSLPWVMMSLIVYCAAWWVYGRWCPIYRSKLTRLIGIICALALGVVGVVYSMPNTYTPGTNTPGTNSTQAPAASYTVASGSTPTWNPWSPELMQRALEDGHPVYVDFTARWCATCLANKKVAYTENVCRKFEEAQVVLMRADKTKPNAAIDSELRRLKRGSVPANALYIPGKDPAVTAELLTPDYLEDFLKSHLPEPAGE